MACKVSERVVVRLNETVCLFEAHCFAEARHDLFNTTMAEKCSPFPRSVYINQSLSLSLSPSHSLSHERTHARTACMDESRELPRLSGTSGGPSRWRPGPAGSPRLGRRPVRPGVLSKVRAEPILGTPGDGKHRNTVVVLVIVVTLIEIAMNRNYQYC